MTGQLTVLVSSPRLPAGVLSYAAWERLRAAGTVLGVAGDPQAAAVAQAGMPVTVIEVAARADARPIATDLVVRALAGEHLVWISAFEGDPGLTDALSQELSRVQQHLSEDQMPQVEILVGSWDPPGARVLDLVAVMDRLRSPGGCPWDARQTHESLVPYLIEEAHEAADAIAGGDRAEMIDELGDVLLQVVFHGRVGQERAEEPFSLNDIAGAIVEKLVRRHPHVFSGQVVSGADEVAANWEDIKAEERAAKGEDERGLLDGIPASLPPLARAAKAIGRFAKAGRIDEVRELVDDTAPGRLLDVLVNLHEAGEDPDSVLRDALRRLPAR